MGTYFKFIKILLFALPFFHDVSQARIIFSDNYEAYNSGDVSCAQLQATSGYTFCREMDASVRPNNPSEITIASSIPGSSETLPSGSRVMRVHTNGYTLQSDGGVVVGNSVDYIPADSWFQIAMYVNNYSNGTISEVTRTGARPMKLFYPCNADYPCNTNYFMIQTTVTSSYNPFNSNILSVPTNGDMWLAARDNMMGNVNWAGAAIGDENKLGQTNLSERIRPNRWNIIRCHTNFSNTSAAAIDCWIGPKGSALVNVLSWHGGTVVAGQPFTWTVPEARGHRQMFFPSTVPANGSTGTELFMYFDDFYLATNESDLPTYLNGQPVVVPRAPVNLRVVN